MMVARSLLHAVVLVSAIGCRTNDDPDAATELMSRIQADDYRGWARAPGYEARTATNAPHAASVEIFLNDVMAEALDSGVSGAWPDGSIVAKDGYDDDGALAQVAIMEKVDGVWFWAELDAEGTPLYSGEPAICTDCHSSGADFVRAFGFP